MENLDKYINHKIGNTPIILSVPHGGTVECEVIPKRDSGVLGIDKGTIELSYEIMNEIKKISSKEPSYIISNIKRTNLDINREESHAFVKESQIAKKIYRDFHTKLRAIIDSNIKKYDYSFLIDIHGFEKHKRPSGYRDVEIVLGTNNLKSLLFNPVPKKDWDKNLRGLIIKRFLDLGIEIAPGNPRRKEYVLTGGFITQKYGASQIPKSQAIQIEFSDTIRYKDSQLRNIVLNTLSEIICDNVF
jgi:N-formylglutamate amidohydrolase